MELQTNETRRSVSRFFLAVVLLLALLAWQLRATLKQAEELPCN